MKKLILYSICLIFAVSCAQRSSPTASNETWVDLTHDFGDDTVYWVTAEPFKRTTVAEGVTPGGFYYSAYNFSAAEHGGTHIDAPVHFAEGKKTVDQIELDQLIAPAVKIDVTAKAATDRDYQISIADIQAWETANGQIPDGSILLLQTGFGAKWPDKISYLGTDKKGPDAVKELRFPGLDAEAAKWLVGNRKIKAVGIDTASIDRGQSTDFGAHITLMTHNIPAFENVADMTGLPAKGFRIIAMPMKIRGGSGAPLRIIASVAPRSE